jgi:diadenosine tetraphosphate (Ap4A) HIT family hydrolase
MHAPTDLATRLLRFEQQLQAYQKLHGDELAELWRALNECKRDLTATLEEDGPNGTTGGGLAHEELKKQEDDDKET